MRYALAMHRDIFDCLVLGAGASGLMAAARASARGRRVVVLDGATKAGRKLRLSGGGKANFSNLNMGPEYFVGANPDFCRSALERFRPQDMLDLVQGAGIVVEEREHGQLFCRDAAGQLLTLLMRRCLKQGCSFVFDSQASAAWREKRQQGFVFGVQSSRGAYYARSLLVATGGPAWPQIGASALGLELARGFGHQCLPFEPALVGLVMPRDWNFSALAGLSLPVNIALEAPDGQSPDRGQPGACFYRGLLAEKLPLLFTRRGISGPAALQASLYWRKNMALLVDFLPHTSVNELAESQGALLVKNFVRRHMPDRLAHCLVPLALAEKKLAQTSRSERDLLHRAVHCQRFVPEGTEDFSRAEVARGGVDTRELSSKSFESKLVPGLYFCGEVLDITGRLGGYNLHWAFASGHAAGLAI